MYTGTIKSQLIVNASNLVGWQTKRKIVVLESDDWGSIRIPSKKDYDSMVRKGLDLGRSNYTSLDCLESNDDLENLFSLFGEFKDSTGRPPVMTPMCVMANPDFEKIKESGFSEYYYENFVETCKRYPNSDRVHNLWKQGISDRLFVPGLHGREHLNVIRWMHALKSNNMGLRIAFDHGSLGAVYYKGKPIPEYLGAFHPESSSEIKSFGEIIETAAYLFYLNCGYSPSCFIAPNKEEPKELEGVLQNTGVKYLTRSKMRKYPLGDNRFKLEFNWMGKRNGLGQICLVRNCFFEPSSWGEFNPNTNWIDNCMKEMGIAFLWHKPSIIISHRVNYVGSINPKYRDRSLRQLKELFTRMLKEWPDIEFLTSEELGELIAQSKK